jgi:hypothetical protein
MQAENICVLLEHQKRGLVHCEPIIVLAAAGCVLARVHVTRH